MSLRFVSSAGIKCVGESDFVFDVKGLSIKKIFRTANFSKEGSPFCIQSFAMSVAELDEFFGVICVHTDNCDPSAFQHLKMILSKQFPAIEYDGKFMTVSKYGQEISVLAFVSVAKPGYIPASGHIKQPSIFHCGGERIPPGKIQNQFRGLRYVSGGIQTKKNREGDMPNPAFS